MQNNRGIKRNKAVASGMIGLGINALALLSTGAALVVSLTAGSQPPSNAAELAPGDVARLAGYYAAPNGTPNGDGSLERPWDLETALQKGNEPGRVVRPGDTIWLRGGTYRGGNGFHSTLLGAEGAPITVQSYTGERAVIDLNNMGDARATFAVMKDGGWTNYRDFEVMNSITGRNYFAGRPRDRSREDKRAQKGHPSGFMIHGANTKFINLIVHDNVGSGMGFWENATDSEIYGCLIFNNGISKLEHGIYSHNKTGAKRITDNIVFNQTGMGISLHNANPDMAPNLRGFDLEGNVSFNNGSILPPADRADLTNYNIMVGMGSPVEDLRLVSNFTYFSQPGNGRVQIGWAREAGNRNLVAQNNYFVEAMDTVNWTGTNVTNNTVIAGRTPADNKVFVRPNKYEAGRANIVVYNWRRQNTAAVNIATAGLKIGQPFEVRNAENFFAAPVLTGTYNGQDIVLPMTGLTTARPVGNMPQPPQPSGPTFNVFIVRPAQTDYRLQ